MTMNNRSLAALIVVGALILTACGGKLPTTPTPTPSITVSPSALSFPSGGGSKEVTVTVTGNVAWMVNLGAGWLSADPTSGTTTAMVKVMAQANTLTVQQVATLTIGGQPVAVTQDAPLPVVYAPPPAGVSPEVWRVAFSEDGKLRRPDAVHLVLPADIAQDQKDNFVAVVAAINQMGLSTPVDLTPTPYGATFVVSVVPNLVCGSWGKTGACTSFGADSFGRITGGTIEFASASGMHVYSAVMHEVLRTLGLTGVTPSGVMALQPTQNMPTAEELAMLLGRYNYPLLAVYTDK